MVNILTLRPGNLLQGEKLSIPRLGMSSDGIVELTAYSIYLYLDSQIPFQLEAIPISHFWFKHFGFARKENEQGKNRSELPYIYYKSFIHNGKMLRFEIFSNEKATHFSLYSKPKFDIDYKTSVHQLQNIYLDFTEQALKRNTNG